MRNILILLIIMLVGTSVFAFDIVYPKKTEVTINSPTTFFIGASDNPLTINEQNVELHRTGAFAHFVNLNYGTNIFEIKTCDKEEIYTIIRPQPVKPQVKTLPLKFVEFSQNRYFMIKEDNTPLRLTPSNSSTNRFTHLQKGVLLICDGEYGSYYRVVLNNNQKVWVNSTMVEPCDEFELLKTPNVETFETDKDFVFMFHFDKRVPFKILEDKDLNLKFYNLEKDYCFSFKKDKYLSGRNLLGYSGEYVDNDFVLKVRKYPPVFGKSLKGLAITIDAGHGGREVGAIGCLGDKEKDINLKISKCLSKELKSKGANVFMTRTDDSYVGLYDRVKIANENDSAFLISIHGNALPDTLDPNKHSGSSVFYYYEQAKPLSECILSSIVEEAGVNNDNIHKESFAVIRNTNALSVLIEIGYLINPNDNELLTNKAFQKQVAKAIADGIENYYLRESCCKLMK